MDPRNHSNPTPAPPDLETEAVAISLAGHPSPRERAALFENRSLAEGVAAFRRRFGAAPPEVRERARRWREASRRAGRRLVLLGTAAYPERLARIPTPPVVIEVAGEADLGAPALAVVGARRATPYGISVAERLGAGLARAGFTVVSGLARGVDAAAHRGALAVGGLTVAVLGSALDRLYPPEHEELARRCAASGAVATEFPPGARPLPHHFPRRNRIIAGLALGVVVVEAAERSGSLATARHAVDCDREVFAVPGPMDSAASAGCHALIRQGAALVPSLEALLQELAESGIVPAAARAAPARAPSAGSLPAGARTTAFRETGFPEVEPAGGGARREAADGPSVSPDARRILRALSAYPAAVDLDSLLSGSGLPVERALAAVSELERSGRVRRFPGDFLKSVG